MPPTPAGLESSGLQWKCGSRPSLCGQTCWWGSRPGPRCSITTAMASWWASSTCIDLNLHGVQVLSPWSTCMRCLDPSSWHCMQGTHSNLRACPQEALRRCRLWKERRSQLQILDNVSGVLRPRRMTLLLGPPASGKSTLLQALAGSLQSGAHLQVHPSLHHTSCCTGQLYHADGPVDQGRAWLKTGRSRPLALWAQWPPAADLCELRLEAAQWTC